MDHRDLQQLEPTATAAVDSTRALVICYASSAQAMTTFVNSVDEWSSCEPGGSFELHALRVLSSAISFSLPHQRSVGEILNEEMLEQMEFLYGSCLLTARAVMEPTVKAYGGATVATSGGGGDDKPSKSSSKHDEGGHNTERDSMEFGKVCSGAVGVSRAWEGGRAARSSFMLNQMLINARKIVGEVKHGTGLILFFILIFFLLFCNSIARSGSTGNMPSPSWEERPR